MVDGHSGEAQLIQYTTQLGLELSAKQRERLLAYVALLQKWNKAYNLTAIREASKMMTHHIIDSLSIAPYIIGDRVLDMGTGAGLPGIPLAILYPEKAFMLVDSVGKKVRFLHQVVTELGLDNVTVQAARVESISVDSLFDVIMARAVSSLANLVSLSEHLLTRAGCFVLQKGEYPTDELSKLSRPYEVVMLDVPGVDAKRHVIIVK